MSEKNKVLLIIMDGWGMTPVEEGNAPLLAATPTLDHLYKKYPKALLSASGLEVGLDRGEVGNSEVGHLNLGTGRVVWENLPRIDFAIEKGEFNDNKDLIQMINRSKGRKLHMVGLLSSGGVHSHMHHLYSLLKVAKKSQVKEVYIHAILDGRDTQPMRAKDELMKFEKELQKIKIGKIVTLIGRYYAMDRDQRWDRTKRAYDLFVKSVGDKYETVKDAIDANYKDKKTDEFFEPSIIEDNKIESGDSVIFFNFRADRMRQLIHAFYDHDFRHFTRNQILPLNIITMMQYDENLKIPTVFNKLIVKDPLAKIVSNAKLKQFHIAETEKYPHVTYFFNGGREDPFIKEKREIVASPQVETYDKKPEMSADRVAEKLNLALVDNYDFALVNFANGDMVGHTGNLNATIDACQAVDKAVDKVLIVASKMGYKTIITADHGNCEIMIDRATGEPCKEHSTNPVPFIFLDFTKLPYNRDSGNEKISGDEYLSYCSESPIGVLADVTVSILELIGIEKSQEMSGENIAKAISV